ncbi:hypothetical protein DVH05_020345 [Phytophthora capsici]|nr:hypothetical protein DVH05_020345 [Phytophthora capsici]
MPLRVLRRPELEAERFQRLIELKLQQQLPTAAAWRQADDRMRVKKLNVNRRHKAGEDEAVAAGGDSEQRKWVSPTKPQRSVRTSGSSSGSSSPTDVQQQQQHLGEHSPLYGGSGGIAVMPNATLDVVMHEEDKNPMRKAMIDRIVETLRAMKPHAPEKVLAALPRLAQHMEKTLYKLAKNEAEYCDQSTLRLRIAHIQENNAKRLLAQQQPQTPEYNGNAAPLKPLPEEQARILFQHLQCWRQKLVNMYGVAPWEILPNPTLAKVALYMPSTEQELAVCGVDKDKIARFGSSLVQELQRLRGPPPSKPVTRPIKSKPGRKPSSGKRGSTEPLAGTNKKRKNGDAAPRLAPAAPSPSFNGTPLMPAASLLPAVDSLPTLLPTVSMIPSGVTGSAGAASNSMAMKQPHFSTSAASRLSPGPISQQQQQQFLTRLQPQQQQGSPTPAQENHMHLLVQGAGQLSKQQKVKSVEAYEQEVQSLRWMLHQSQQEKAQLEMEIQRLRAELQGTK